MPMNFIVLDLEWNQCPYGKTFEDKQLPFEIIEIGAVISEVLTSKMPDFSLKSFPISGNGAVRILYSVPGGPPISLNFSAI